LLDTHKDVVTMSTAGIQRGVPGTFVYLITPDSTVTVRPVKLGVTDGSRVEVLSGVEPGDRVVIDGADKLREAAKVIVRAEADPNNPAAADKGGGGDKTGGQKKRRPDGEQKPGEKKQDEPKQGEPKP
jgi:multidrug efflux system membrane fusion protein